METKTYLQQIERLEHQIQNKVSEIYRLKAMAVSVAVSVDSERVQTSKTGDGMSSAVAKIVDAENEAQKLIENFIDKRKHIIGQIDSMEDNNFYHVLTGRYVLFKTLDEIAEEMRYSRAQINRIHGNALLAFEKKYGKEYLNTKDDTK